MTRHVSVISITLSTVPLDRNSPGYQPPLPPEMVKTHLSPAPHIGPVTGEGCGFLVERFEVCCTQRMVADEVVDRWAIVELDCCMCRDIWSQMGSGNMSSSGSGGRHHASSLQSPSMGVIGKANSGSTRSRPLDSGGSLLDGYGMSMPLGAAFAAQQLLQVLQKHTLMSNTAGLVAYYLAGHVEDSWSGRIPI